MLTILPPAPRHLLDALRADSNHPHDRGARIAEDIDAARLAELDAFARVVNRTLPATGIGLLKAREREARRRVRP